MPDWTKAELRAALLARGNYYLTAQGNTLPDELLQESVEEYTLEHTWPWRLTSTTSTLPATIADLGTVAQILDSNGRTLLPTDAEGLRDRYGHLTETGSALYYYKTGLRTVAVYPVSTDTFTIHYYSTYGWRTPGGVLEQEPSVEASVPAAPPEERDLILLLARQRTHSLNGDLDLAGGVREEYDGRLEEIRSQFPNVDELVQIEITQSDWA